ncbi:MAG: GMC family oxidoreductase [Thermomicrobiales bacterium]
MAQLDKVDVVTVGAGWTSGILAQQLTAEGMSVVSLEQGPMRETHPDFTAPWEHDELRYQVRRDMMVDLSQETWTWRPGPNNTALPMRQYGSFNPGKGVGGAGIHWAAQNWRFYPSDFQYRTHHIGRYGEDKLPAGNRIQDWPITYEDLEPFYDQFEYDIGVSGKAGNIQRQQIDGGNVFEGARQREYPLPPLPTSITANRFTEATKELGYHPLPQPAAILSEAYTDASGEERGACLLCGFCTRYGCEIDAKASAITTHIPMAMKTGKYEIRTNAYVFHIDTDGDGLATGVRYIDASGREQFQPADIVIVSAFPLMNAKLLLMSDGPAHKNGVGNDWNLVGKNYTYQLGGGGSSGLLEGMRLNRFMGNRCVQSLIHDFNADNFDHSDLDFIGGGSIGSGGGERTPVSSVGGVSAVSGARWGQEWKDALRSDWDSVVSVGLQGESLPYEDSFLDLDPTYRDRFGFPLLRLTFDWHENDYNLVRYLSTKMKEMLETMGATNIQTQEELNPYSIAPYQSTHNTGGAIMGSDQGNSVVNKYSQVWDTPNVFVTGASNFPQNAGMNPTGTVCALAYHTAHGNINSYLNAQGEIISDA